MADGRVRRFGAFEALQLLVGKGGQGRLFAARCLEEGAFEGLHVGDEVVLKAMPVRADDPDKAYRRLARRTAALVAARHPGIVRYYGCFETEGGGIDDAMHVVVMELLRGETLEERLRREPLGLDGAESLAILRACLEALVHAASFGIVHRDIKPSNVFLCEDGGVKLIDFEVARQATSAQTTTESGAMQGTFDYMAPDFHPNFRPDPKFRGDQCSDVFSLAVTFHEMLAGRRPYAAAQTLGDQSMMAFFQRWTKAEGTDPRRAIRIDGVRVHSLRHLQRILRKALQPERTARYQTYAEFLAALSRVEPRVLEGGRARYRLSKCIGKGGFGVVYKAFREDDGAAVAIKVLLRAEYAERFDREGRVLMRFDDDRIVTFVEAFAGGDPMAPTHFLVMRYLEGMPGSSLKDRLAADPSRRGLPRAETLSAFVRFAEGLQILHDEGVYHRDIKPANLYFPAGEPQRACLMDLGVVRTDETQTNGGLPGTLDYMAPELATGGSRGDASADLYALGLCLYEALTGRTAYPRLPRGSEGVAAFYARARSGEGPDLSGLDGEPELQALVRSMTAVDRSARPATAREAARLLRSVPFREEEPREAVSADGVYSEDTTDDLVLPPTPPPSAPAPASSAPSFASSSSGSAPAAASVPPPEEEGGETRAIPAAAGEETVAAVGEGEGDAGETAAFPPEGDGASEPEPAVAEAEGGGETAVAPEPEPAAADAEAETRVPGDGETVAAADAGEETVAGEPGETAAAADETAASPTAAAAEGLTATAVAETIAPEGGTTTAAVEGLTATAATMAAEAGTTTAVAEGFTATAATMAAEGETAATAAVDETSATAATAAFKPEEPVRPASRSAWTPVRSSKGVREVRPAPRWRSVAAAACVLLLCGAAAGVYFFQDRLHGILNPEPVPPPVTTTTTTQPPGMAPSGNAELEKRIKSFVDNDAIQNPSGNTINTIENDYATITNDILMALAGKTISQAVCTNWLQKVDETRSILWTRHFNLSNRVESLTGNQDLPSNDHYKTYKGDAEKLKDDINRHPYESVREEYSNKVDDWWKNVEEKKRNLDKANALAAANEFSQEASKADQEERKRLILKASERMEEAESRGWSDVREAYAEATNQLQKAIAAYDKVDEAVKSAEKARGFDALVGAYADLVAKRSTPDIPEDAEASRAAALSKVKKSLDADHAKFDKECETVPNKETYDGNVEKAGERQEKALENNLSALAKKYGDTLSRIKKDVALTIENKSGTPLRVTVDGVEYRLEVSKKPVDAPVHRWSTVKVSAVAQEHPEDYDPWSADPEIENTEKLLTIEELKQKPLPKLFVNSTSKVLQASLDGKEWHSVPHTFEELEPRTEYPVHWRIDPKRYPEDYVQADGQTPGTTGNCGSDGTEAPVTIDAPKLKSNPNVTFRVSDTSARRLNVTVNAKDTGKSFRGNVGQAIPLEPRTEWVATFEWADDEAKKWWMPVEETTFSTTARGQDCDPPVVVARKPVICMKNTSLETLVVDGDPVPPNDVWLRPGNPKEPYSIPVKIETAENSFDLYAPPENQMGSFLGPNQTNAVPLTLAFDVKKAADELVRQIEVPASFERLFNRFKELDQHNQLKPNDISALLNRCLKFAGDEDSTNNENGTGQQLSVWLSVFNASTLACWLSNESSARGAPLVSQKREEVKNVMTSIYEHVQTTCGTYLSSKKTDNKDYTDNMAAWHQFEELYEKIQGE